MLPRHQRTRSPRGKSPSGSSSSSAKKSRQKKTKKRPRSRSISEQHVRNRTSPTKPTSQTKKSKFTTQPGDQPTTPKPPTTTTPSGLPIQRIQPHLQKNYKFALKLLISNLPQNPNKDHLVSHLCDTLQRCRGTLQPGSPIISSNYSPESRLVFLVMRSMEETVQLLALDGVFYRRKSLRIKRPVEYETETKMRRVEGTRILPKMELSQVKMSKVATTFLNNFNKLFFTNFSLELEEENIMDVLGTFGKLRAFVLVTDKQTNRSKGFGHCEFQTDLETENCLKKLNGTNINAHIVSIKRAILVSAHQQSTGTPSNSQYLNKFQQQPFHPPSTSTSTPYLTSTLPPKKPSAFQKDQQSHYALLDLQHFFKSLKISCVLLLRNIIPLSVDPEVIKKDLEGQLRRIGPVVKLVHKGQNVWVEYERVEYSQIAYLLLLNHKYDGKLVEVAFYDPIAFADNLY